MRFHIIDPHCSVAGGEDFGAVDTREEADKIVAERIANGDEGGCRCGRGYLIQTCEERTKVNIGWTERQERDVAMFATGFLNLNGYRPRDGVKRELTPEEVASHKCYNYQPRRFQEILNDFYDTQYTPLEFTSVEDIDEGQRTETTDLSDL
jgi:hypothetical protein